MIRRVLSALALALAVMSFGAFRSAGVDATVYLPIAVQSRPQPEHTPVPDITVERLNCISEFVHLVNTSGRAIDLSGWLLESARAGRGTQVYTFGAYVLRPDQDVYVHSGPQQIPPGSNRFKWSGRYMWNDDGDRAELYSPEGRLVDWEACWQS